MGRLRDERGYTLTEMLTVLAILGTVLTGLTALFVAGSKAEIDMNKRFQAQQNARLALDKVRGDAHCASNVDVADLPSAIALDMAACTGVAGSVVYYCAVGSGSRYTLYRGTTSCGTSAQPIADYLTSGSVFGYAAQSTTSLAKLEVDFVVDVDPADGRRGYRLNDAIALRNSTRT